MDWLNAPSMAVSSFYLKVLNGSRLYTQQGGFFFISIHLVGEIKSLFLVSWKVLNAREGTINFSPHRVAYMSQWTGSSLVQVIACHLFGAKPLPESMLTDCQPYCWKQVSLQFEFELYHFRTRKCISKCCLPNWRPFCRGGGGGGGGWVESGNIIAATQNPAFHNIGESNWILNYLQLLDTKVGHCFMWLSTDRFGIIASFMSTMDMTFSVTYHHITRNNLWFMIDFIFLKIKNWILHNSLYPEGEMLADTQVLKIPITTSDDNVRRWK